MKESLKNPLPSFSPFVWFHNSYYLLHFAIKHFDFLKFILGSSQRKKEIQKKDYYTAGGAAFKPPYEVCLYLTRKCNLRCSMCPYYGESGIYSDMQSEELNHVLDLEVYRELAGQLKEYNTFYYLSGGEPLLYPFGIGNLIRILKTKFTRVSINTNGYLLEDQASDLIDADLDLIIVSIDGPPDVHDRIRNKTGSYDRAAAGIKRLVALRKKKQLNHPIISALWTLNKENYDYLDLLPEIYNELEIDMGGVNFMCFTDKKRGEESARIISEFLDNKSDHWKGCLVDTKSINLEVLKAKYKSLLRAKKDFMFYSMPANLKIPEIQVYYKNPAETFGNNICWKAWYRTHISPNGEVTTCEFFPPGSMGNIREMPFLSIWNGKKYRKYRSYLQKNGILPHCTRCTELYPP